MKKSKKCNAFARFLGIVLISIISGGPVKRVLAILHMKKIMKNGDFSNKMKLIRSSMKGSSWFTSPPVSVADGGQFDTDIKAFDVAETSALTRVKGSVAARNIAKKTLLNDVRLLLGYVQTIADANPVKAENIVESAGFDIKTIAPHNKNDFDVRNSGVSGTVKLIVNLKKITTGQGRYAFKWQLSNDGGKTAIDLPVTITATTMVNGLTPGTYEWFRYMVVLKDGEHGWSEWEKVLVA